MLTKEQIEQMLAVLRRHDGRNRTPRCLCKWCEVGDIIEELATAYERVVALRDNFLTMTVLNEEMRRANVRFADAIDRALERK